MAKYIYDIEITRGETFDRSIEFEAMDLTGKTGKAQVRPEPGSDTLSAEFGCSIDYGKSTLRLTLTSDQTNAMVPGTYAYDVWLIGADFSRPYIAGKFIVSEHVTDPMEA